METRCVQCKHYEPIADICMSDGCKCPPNWKKEHKCKHCTWGTFAGTKYKCVLPRCIPELGNFGVGKNG